MSLELGMGSFEENAPRYICSQTVHVNDDTATNRLKRRHWFNIEAGRGVGDQLQVSIVLEALPGCSL